MTNVVNIPDKGNKFKLKIKPTKLLLEQDVQGIEIYWVRSQG